MSGGVAPATPLPWHLFMQNSVIEIWDNPNVDDARAVVHWTGFDNAQGERKAVRDNAAYIVHAANCHPDLVEALEGLLPDFTGGLDPLETDAVFKARGALAKAREGGAS